MIKEIKTIYSGRVKSITPVNVSNDIKAISKPAPLQRKHSFFNSVIDKLNIIVEDKD